MPGICSITDSSNTDCALSATGPYESTAIVTGPMPRNPNATSPNANTGGAIMILPKPRVLTPYAIDIKPTIASPIQNALKLPAVRPDRMLSDAPPSRDDATISPTCPELVDVKIFTSSGIIAPASVPQEIIVASFHHSDVSSPRLGISSQDVTYVTPIEMNDVSHTSHVSGL